MLAVVIPFMCHCFFFFFFWGFGYKKQMTNDKRSYTSANIDNGLKY